MAFNFRGFNGKKAQGDIEDNAYRKRNGMLSRNWQRTDGSNLLPILCPNQETVLAIGRWSPFKWKN